MSFVFFSVRNSNLINRNIFKMVDLCRVCLSKKPEKYLYQLTSSKKDGLKSYLNIFRFCLDIQVKDNSNITSKLCSRCFKKLNTFYKFKTMALKNDAYLRSINSIDHEALIKLEPFHADEVLVEPVTRSNESDRLKNAKSDTLEEYVPILKIKLNSVEENSADSELDEEVSHTQDSEDYCISNEHGASTSADLILEENGNTEKTKLKSPKSKLLKGALIKPKAKYTNKGPGICEQCGASVQNLKVHALKHIPKQQREQYPCKLCDKIYIEPSALRRHHKRKHLGILSHCDICNKDVTSLKVHQLMKHNRDTLPWQCAVCELRFPTPSALDQHSTLHMDKKNFQCDVCGKNFRLKQMLDTHVRMVHHKEKNYFCAVCKKGFFRKSTLDIHMRSHTKEKPCKCVECGKSFVCPSTLRNHMRCHSDVRAYHCILCDKSFVSASTLYMHKRAHRQERPYKCRHCDAQYARTFDRNRHERNYHQHETQAENNDNPDTLGQ